jgi:alkanesulfonate monooxygenase SsuD/methylene tetrahydromethanopterin reductase-like flavin-dependent oxidoreductase (luciferase family)
VYVSLHMSPQSRGETEDGAMIDELVEHATEADAAGVAAICLTEHHLGGFNTYSDPFMMGAYLAARLRQAYVALHIIQVPLRHPMRIVESANLLDLLARGRAMIGLAPGSIKQVEFDAFGVEHEARSEMTRQSIEAMMRAWSWRDGDEPADLSTDYRAGTMAGRITPSSYRRPHPLIGRATMSDATIIDTAKRGWPVIFALRADDEENRRQATLYRETLERSAHPPHVVRDCLAWLGFMSVICLAETQREARRRIEEYAEVAGAAPIVTAANQGLLRNGPGNGALRDDWRHRQQGRAKMALAGTPEMVVDHLLGYADVGVEHARVAFVMTPGKHDENLESLRLFLDHVLPHLDPQSLPEPAATAATGSAEREAALDACADVL